MIEFLHSFFLLSGAFFWFSFIRKKMLRKDEGIVFDWDKLRERD